MNIYSVVFKEAGKSYYFKSVEKIDLNTSVIVQTEKGVQYGKVIEQVDRDKINISLDSIKDILRISTDEDYEKHLKNMRDADRAMKNAKEIVQELSLEMNLIDASYTFDRKQLLFNFLADDRVDFRELAKRLAGIYRTRIELRQIGARDKAKEIGGLGPCGMELCCTRFLHHMDSISMGYAKNQNLTLNPTKINGQCGRLLCCLTYENEEYARCQKGMPYVGQTIKTDFGQGKVVSVDILNRKYKVDIDGDKKEIELEKV